MIQAVIFDMDGTLVDSVDYHAASIHRAMAEHGKHVAYADIRFQIGKGMDHLLPAFLDEKELAAIGDSISKRKGEIFKSEYLPNIKAFPDVRDLFLRLLEDGKKIAIASSAEKEELEELKRIAGIEDLLDAQTSSDEVNASKPAPDIFQAALKHLGSPSAEQALCVGDTPYDIQSAAAAGMRTVAVRCGGFPEETLKQAIAIYDDPADLLRHYQVSPMVW